jgi:hypothetical protein
VNAAPATPAAPTHAVTQPTCAVATGTITITSATAGLTFSVNGGAYAAYPAGGYTGLAAGPYTITAQNAAGCISADANATVMLHRLLRLLQHLLLPPTCAVATGTITITSPTAGLTFSVNGGAYAAYPAGGYTGLAAGPYTITAQNAAGCISADANATVNAAPATPAAPTLNVTQPTCTVATGTITITSATAG